MNKQKKEKILLSMILILDLLQKEVTLICEFCTKRSNPAKL